MPRCKVDVQLNEGDSITVGNVKLEVWHTPGHTAGQLSFKMGNLLFSGDNIYKDSCVGVIDAHHGSNIPEFIKSLRRIVKDYYLICESYYEAIRSSTPSHIEAIDMGRRGLHNEGSQTLMDRLAGKIEIDFDTARRLFTLVCVLHWRG